MVSEGKKSMNLTVSERTWDEAYKRASELAGKYALRTWHMGYCVDLGLVVFMSMPEEQQLQFMRDAGAFEYDQALAKAREQYERGAAAGKKAVDEANQRGRRTKMGPRRAG